MNPLTNVRNIIKLNEKELEIGVTGKGKSWHDQYKDSAWVFIGGLPFDLTEGDIICVFSQYGEVVNINLVRDQKTGKSKGYSFLCYEDQRSTILAIDNLNGFKLLNRTLRVDHVENYKTPKEHGDEDIVTKDLRMKGVAPKVVMEQQAANQQQQQQQQQDQELSSDPESPMDKQKKKKRKEKKKKKKKSIAGADSDEDEPPIKRPKKEPSESPPRVKQERFDRDTDGHVPSRKIKRERRSMDRESSESVERTIKTEKQRSHTPDDRSYRRTDPKDKHSRNGKSEHSSYDSEKRKSGKDYQNGNRDHSSDSYASGSRERDQKKDYGRETNNSSRDENRRSKDMDRSSREDGRNSRNDDRRTKDSRTSREDDRSRGERSKGDDRRSRDEGRRDDRSRERDRDRDRERDRTRDRDRDRYGDRDRDRDRDRSRYDRGRRY